MAWVCVDEGGKEWIFSHNPKKRARGEWLCYDEQNWREYGINLPNGSIKKLIGRELFWEDEPVELKEE